VRPPGGDRSLDSSPQDSKTAERLYVEIERIFEANVANLSGRLAV